MIIKKNMYLEINLAVEIKDYPLNLNYIFYLKQIYQNLLVGVPDKGVCLFGRFLGFKMVK